MTTRVIPPRIPPRPEGKGVRAETVIADLDPTRLVQAPCRKRVQAGDGFVQAPAIDGG